MTNLRGTLDTLKRARAILAVSYIRFRQSNYQGGHCSLGAIAAANGWELAPASIPEALLLSETASALHPEFRNTVTDRNDGYMDIFNDCPIVFVNNHLGKEETLRVWDVTIAELELRLAAVEGAPVAKEAELELVAR